MRPFIDRLQRDLRDRLLYGAWTSFSIDQVFWHVAIWSGVLVYGMTFRHMSRTWTSIYAWLLLVVLCELLVHLCRNWRELLYAFSCLMFVGMLCWPMGILRPGTIWESPISILAVWNAKLRFLGGVILVTALKPPEWNNLVTTYRWDFLSCLRMLGSHCAAWLVVGSYERVAAFAINDRRLVFFFFMVETAALVCRSFVRLFSAVVLLHVIGLTVIFYGATPDPTQAFEFVGSVYFWLWPELSLPGWVFLCWMLSPAEEWSAVEQRRGVVRTQSLKPQPQDTPSSS